MGCVQEVSLTFSELDFPLNIPLEQDRQRVPAGRLILSGLVK